MYCNFFGFSERPFEISADPDFLYLSAGHREILASLLYGIQERRGLIAVIGEVGTGKTTMLKTLMDKLTGKTSYAYLYNSSCSFEDLINLALIEFGILERGDRLPTVSAIQRLQALAIEKYESGGNVVLIVDEAQNLDRDLMENLRLLSNLETRKHKLIQIILSGQVELDEKLSRYDLRQLAQRINLRRYVIPLSHKDTFEYIQHRLSLAGYRGPALFSQRALRLIRNHSGGIPRKINVLCDNALLTAYGLNQKQISSKIIKEAILDLRVGHSFKPLQQNRILWWVSNKLKELLPGIARPILIVGLMLVAACVGASWSIFREDLSASSISTLTASTSAQQTVSDYHPLSTKDPQNLPPRSAVQSERKRSVPLSLNRIKNMPGNSLPAPSVPNGQEMVTDKMAIDPRLIFKPGAKTPVGGPLYVIAKKGDSLSGIIRRYYGDFNKKLLMEVIKENQTIQNENLIEVGQAIRLPQLSP